jgi:hypothetical protein
VSIITFSNISAIYLTEAMGEESLISYITNWKLTWKFMILYDSISLYVFIQLTRPNFYLF